MNSSPSRCGVNSSSRRSDSAFLAWIDEALFAAGRAVAHDDVAPRPIEGAFEGIHQVHQGLRRARLDPGLDVAVGRRSERGDRHALGARWSAGKAPGTVLLNDQVVSGVLFKEHAGGGADFAGVEVSSPCRCSCRQDGRRAPARRRPDADNSRGWPPCRFSGHGWNR